MNASRLACLLVVLTSCGDYFLDRPKDTPTNRAITSLWMRDVRRIAQDGDIILSRSYTLSGDAIVAFSSGEDLSHSAIVDATNGVIVESIPDEGTVISPLSKIIAPRNRYVMLLRFTHLSPIERRAGLLRALSKVGTPYDMSGLIGLPDEDEYYCSEIIYRVFDLHEQDDDAPALITPSDLLRYGEIVYFSGARDDPQVIRAASIRAKRGERNSVGSQ